MNIHTSSMPETCKALATYHISFEAQYLPSEQTYLLILDSKTTWQELVAMSTQLGPSEFDFKTNTLYLED